jgi:LmbE family N-acetylglucosaminyl deacetylase
MKIRFWGAWLLIFPLTAWGQVSTQPSSSTILLRLKKLNVLGSVLYVAAHPDDENTRAIAFLANDRLVSTAYLSLTRGDGGQNLIGSEIRDQLGLIRTQELLAARRLDGGLQFFTRANDFGFSKSASESFDIWGKDQILSDVVYIIRQFQPDIMITRFPPDERAGHGHHTASAMLAQEAFDLAADPNAFPEQLAHVKPWQVKRMFTNTGRWWNQTVNENTPGVVSVNVGTYNSLLGKSYSELAAESRTQHKSQGFGSSGRRGDALEFFEHVKGTKAQKELFDMIDLTWKRLPGGAAIEKSISKAIALYQPSAPAASVPALLQIRKQISLLPSSIWRDRKLADVNDLIKDCLGLYVDVVSEDYQVVPGQSMKLSVEVINRSAIPLELKKIESASLAWDSAFVLNTGSNKLNTFTSRKNLARDIKYSDPFWLANHHSLGQFTLPDHSFIGQAENKPPVSVAFTFHLQNETYTMHVPVVYKTTDPVKGEITRPLAVVPDLLVSLDQPVYIFKDHNPKKVQVKIKSAVANTIAGEVQLSLPEGWKSVPEKIRFEITRKYEEHAVSFSVIPGAAEGNFTIGAVAHTNEKIYDQSIQIIAYDHIPTQTLLPKAVSKANRINLQTVGKTVAYIKGAGDDVPLALRNMGYEVWEMKNEEITPENLKSVQAVVLGVRALNTNDRIRFTMPTLLKYVEEGGNLIIQYNTNFDLEIELDKFAPFPLTLSRDRVTEETSEVRFLMPEHPVLNYPNKITAVDFSNWVQERGLYFPSKWDSRYAAPLSMNDTKEPARNGSLLIAPYGQGNFVYTGLSFFRELPEGVTGAYRLFANLVSMSPRATGSTSSSPSGK